MSDLLFGEKDIYNYIEDISCIKLSRSTLFDARKTIYLPYVKPTKNRFMTTSKKIVKAWLSTVLIKSYFTKNYKTFAYKFLFGSPYNEVDPLIVMTMLQTIWIDD